MYEIQIQFNGCWVTVGRGYLTKDDAEWATALWKQRHKCVGDPFRAVKSEERPRVAAPSAN